MDDKLAGGASQGTAAVGAVSEPGHAQRIKQPLQVKHGRSWPLIPMLMGVPF